ncbi:hypothetical protein L218DRAFT_997689 [Marasmius fiardii PR-910]|nr:hypothetical protein L218DRAFT_997689 [Marasmius fiardii PR-910]
MSEKKTESTTSLIPKGSAPATESKSVTQNDTAGSKSDSGAVKVPTSIQDFSQKSQQHGWAAPTPTKPTLG